ncbi:DUF6952 family protein [Fluviispira multicolorata]|uniref:Uncharacterized protein n=1 Tax=Fluviispira multicolorata TaxID=2654512 RepID=A0A833JDU2_9BACT|nr:hypothetical protein [Fluviispira multicolorata]KAB8029156.1 hypothetical protein GCL57_11505 [Fluviispira multicolorata]
MDLKMIKELSQKYSVEELSYFADELENIGKTNCPECKNKSDLNELMSDFLQAGEVRKMLDKGISLNEAVREFSKRIRAVLS